MPRLFSLIRVIYYSNLYAQLGSVLGIADLIGHEFPNAAVCCLYGDSSVDARLLIGNTLIAAETENTV